LCLGSVLQIIRARNIPFKHYSITLYKGEQFSELRTIFNYFRANVTFSATWPTPDLFIQGQMELQLQQVNYKISMLSNSFEFFNKIECGSVVPSCPRFIIRTVAQHSSAKLMVSRYK